jgi:hypothetical protein
MSSPGSPGDSPALRTALQSFSGSITALSFEEVKAMSDGQPILKNPGSIGRRRFLKVTGGAVAGSSLLTMLDARQAPAQLKGTTLRIPDVEPLHPRL